MTLPLEYTKLTLAERPTGRVGPSTFKVEKTPLSTLTDGLQAGQALVRVDWISIDPAMRGWLREARSYVEPVKLGAVMRALAIGTVVKVAEPSKFQVGDVVRGTFGWTEYVVGNEKTLEKLVVPTGATALDFMGPLGPSGMTAYFGLFDVAKIKSGETLVVSGAAGAVGSLVCQIGKMKGAKVIALAGTEDKVNWLQNEIGVDRALNYKSETFAADFKDAVGYLDVFFDNVGGEILDLALTRLNKGARIALCGAISEYNSAKPKGITNYLSLIGQRAKIEGFIVFDYAPRYPEAIAEISKWLADGSLKRKYHIENGLERSPECLNMLFDGGNTGKLVVKVSTEQSNL